MKNFLKAFMFSVFGILLFILVQDILTPDYTAVGAPENSIAGFYALDNNTVDALIIGASHPVFGISPMRLYEESGIVSYILATGHQPIECSYYMLKEALKTQHPKVVLLDPDGLYLDEESQINAAWRRVSDYMPIDDVKIELAKDYGNRWFSDGYWSIFFPIIKYHGRWEELTKKDFAHHWNGMYYTAGEIIVSKINPSPATMDDIEWNLRQIRDRDSGYKVEFNGEIVESNSIGEILFPPVISESNLDYLIKIKTLCQNNGAELILVTVPTIQYPWANGGWNSEKSSIMKKYAAAQEIKYLDLACDYDLVDFTTDTFDMGMHLNCLGTGKVTHFLSEYLQSIISPVGNNKLYDLMLKKYNDVLDIALLESEIDFHAYIERLSQHLDNYIVFITSNNGHALNMTANDYALLKEKLGLRILQDNVQSDSYIAVIEQGRLMYETLSNRKVEYNTKIESSSVDLCSSGWFDSPYVSTKINGIEYVQGGRGLNFVIYDYKTGLVIDSVSFDTFQASMPATRNWDVVETYLRAYESKVCFGEDAA